MSPAESGTVSAFRLSISIPTHNRGEFIEETLRQACQQAVDASELVEVIVNDNASSDQTKDICQRVALDFPLLRYFCNVTNVGMDRNFRLAVDRAQGEFVWTFCDDDLIEEGAVKVILDRLRRFPDCALFFLNYSLWDRTFSKCQRARGIALEADVHHAHGPDFLHEFTDEIIRASCLILKRNASRGAFAERYLDVKLCGILAIALQCLQRGGGYFIEKPLLRYRGANIPWAGVWPIVDMYFVPRIFAHATAYGFYRATLKKVCNARRRTLRSAILYWKLSRDPAVIGLVSAAELAQLYARHSWFQWQEAWLLPIPRFFFRTARSSYRWLRPKNSLPQ